MKGSRAKAASFLKAGSRVISKVVWTGAKKSSWKLPKKIGNCTRGLIPSTATTHAKKWTTLQNQTAQNQSFPGRVNLNRGLQLQKVRKEEFWRNQQPITAICTLKTLRQFRVMTLPILRKFFSGVRCLWLRKTKWLKKRWGRFRITKHRNNLWVLLSRRKIMWRGYKILEGEIFRQKISRKKICKVANWGLETTIGRSTAEKTTYQSI